MPGIELINPGADGRATLAFISGDNDQSRIALFPDGKMRFFSAGSGFGFINKAGSEVFTVSESGTSFLDLNLGDGSAAMPSLAFMSEDSTGIFRPGAGTIGFSILSTETIRFTAGQILGPDGTAVAPGFSFLSDLTSGITLSGGQLSLSVGGGAQFSVGAIAAVSTLPFYLPDGSSVSPSLTFGSDPTTGIFLQAAGVLGFSIAGVESFRMNGNQLLTPDGAGGNPAWSFLSDPASGVYISGLGDLRFISSTSEKLRICSVGLVVSNGFVEFPDGTAANPSIGFNSSTTTGLFLPAAGVLGFSSAGSEKMRLTNDPFLGIDTNAPHSTMHSNGSIAGKFASTNASPYNLGNTDWFLSVDASGGAIVVNLPTAAGITGREYTIKKIDASLNPVTITPSGAETIDGLAPQVLAAQWARLTIVSDGTNWLIK